MPRHTPYGPGYPFQTTSRFGSERKRADGTKKKHGGVDYGAPEGTDIPAASEGRVVFSANNTTYGNTIIIEHTAEWGKRFYTLFAHLKNETKIPHGTLLKAGEKIGEVGDTGSKPGEYHLHFEVLYPDGNDSQGPYFLNGKEIQRLNTTPNSGANIGISPGVGRRDPETFEGYGGEVFAKGHPKFRQYRHEQVHSIMDGQSAKQDKTPSASRHSRGGNSGPETLERHGTEVVRIEADGSTRGSFQSE